MSRIAYIDGRFLPYRSARVHIDDRGFQFGDGVYEVCEIRDGALIDESRHLARLERSLAALRIGSSISQAALRFVMREIVARNRVRDGIVYVQATRGVARRDHAFPGQGAPPGLVVTARAIDRRLGEARAVAGVRVVTTSDLRWARCDIKSLQLLPNVLAKQHAREHGAYEAWLVDALGRVTEGASTTAWIVTPGGALVTRQTDAAILPGVTRATLLALLAAEGLRFEERAFSVEEAQGAREAFLTSAVNIVTPVVAIDERAIGDGRPGPIALGLRARLHAFAEVSGR
ncbi:MAG: D-amino-acid transaminase [Roseiarcus sp.]|jgi:D-alanine transaminase